MRSTDCDAGSLVRVLKKFSQKQLVAFTINLQSAAQPARYAERRLG